MLIKQEFMTFNADKWLTCVVPAHKSAKQFISEFGLTALMYSAVETTQISVQRPQISTSVPSGKEEIGIFAMNVYLFIT